MLILLFVAGAEVCGKDGTEAEVMVSGGGGRTDAAALHGLQPKSDLDQKKQQHLYTSIPHYFPINYSRFSMYNFNTTNL